jgi:lipopolysaccharide/colanic/teichoic acid biosynthesis glycosyltransferase
MLRDIIKRIIDIILTIFAIIMFAPVMLITAILIKMDSSGPVFYKQVRIGQNGKPFKLWKFRTMVNNAHLKGHLITSNHDSRITRIGGFIRSVKFDELPNLFNIISGDMSIVGPRPEVPEYVNRYDERMEEIFKVKPGLTGPAQLVFFNEEKLINKDNVRMIYPKIKKKKLELDAMYAKSYNPLLDIQLIAKTVIKLLQPQDDGMPDRI